MASASIAQVHRATLRGANGNPDQDVVVKVQHPGIEELMRLDMAALLQICRLVACQQAGFLYLTYATRSIEKRRARRWGEGGVRTRGGSRGPILVKNI